MLVARRLKDTFASDFQSCLYAIYSGSGTICNHLGSGFDYHRTQVGFISFTDPTMLKRALQERVIYVQGHKVCAFA